MWEALRLLFLARKGRRGYWVYSHKYQSWEFREAPTYWVPEQDHP